ncbi:MAG: hypothetical protein ACK5HR_05910, partial [Mycoplasmatales bacterium]
NYDKTYNKTVEKGVGSFACDYGEFSEQKEWYPKKDGNEKITYNIIANNSIKLPGVTKQVYVNPSCVNIVKEEENYVEKKSKDGLITCQISYLKGNIKEYREIQKNPDGSNKNYEEVKYYDSGDRNRRYYRTYNYKGKYSLVQETLFAYDIPKEFTEMKYYDSGDRMRKYHRLYYTNGKYSLVQEVLYASNNPKEFTEDKNDEFGIKYRRYHRLYHGNGQYSIVQEILYNSGKTTKFTENRYDTKGSKIKKYIRNYTNGNPTVAYTWIYKDGKQTSYTKAYY